jgi:hypothetical protein
MMGRWFWWPVFQGNRVFNQGRIDLSGFGYFIGHVILCAMRQSEVLR